VKLSIASLFVLALAAPLTPSLAADTKPASDPKTPATAPAQVTAPTGHEGHNHGPAQPAAPISNVRPAATRVAADDTLALLERSVARDSSGFRDLYRLGVMYLDRDRPSEAARVLNKANQLRPKDVKVLVNLGAARDAEGNPFEAQRHYRAALEVSPGDSVATCRLAGSLYSSGKHQEAVDLLRDVIRDKPTSHCAYFALGVAFADAGIYREAIRNWKKVVELAPTSAEAISARESIEVLEKALSQ
jgi:Flp pilus assembly protein TadD